ncbi:MAG: hypothetical protein NXI19_10600 [Alphaproteobacteria bacterium]|jgi:hypothetical protein|nr:hypothetical protein [Alphaproteobacteria bacterium]
MLGVSESAISNAESLIWLAQAYVWVGAPVAAVFLLWGIDRIDHSARGSYLFRLFALPGVVGLWPLVVTRWIWLELRGADRHGSG